MNAIHPETYHLVKAEEGHRLAAIERRRMVTSHPRQQSGPTLIRVAPTIRRRFALAAGAVALAVAMVAGVAAAAPQGSSAGGGGGGCGGHAVKLAC